MIDKVFEIDPAIRFAGIADNSGQFLEGGMRPGVVSLTPEEITSKMIIQTALARGMAKSWEEYFGKEKFSVIAHEKLTVLRFPFRRQCLAGNC